MKFLDPGLRLAQNYSKKDEKVFLSMLNSVREVKKKGINYANCSFIFTDLKNDCCH